MSNWVGHKVVEHVKAALTCPAFAEKETPADVQITICVTGFAQLNSRHKWVILFQQFTTKHQQQFSARRPTPLILAAG
jgi:hypothetical protein